MIRETLNADSRNASVFLTPSNGIACQWRSATGGGTSNAVASGLTAPYWVRVARTGNSMVGYYSTNGATWTPMSTQTISMATNVYIGLAVTSHTNSTLCTATLDNVTATP
jgi:regulation of enolase protein 1 (concanavalin A-like superfamily)